MRRQNIYQERFRDDKKTKPPSDRGALHLAKVYGIFDERTEIKHLHPSCRGDEHHP